jgi:beta-glucosidase-like glycosyl hydrolase/LmbE family N-acetylglucosaminyl deacetylase
MKWVVTLLLFFLSFQPSLTKAQSQKEIYLRQLEGEWLKIAEHMHTNGYNVNFSPVVDVANNIEDINHPLVKKQRIYSQDPQIVTELASAAIRGMLKAGITPVAKHFPGLGAVYSNTHLTLPKINISKTQLYEKDLLPFREIIKRYPNAWIMTSHAVYSSLDDKPASLSYTIQTELLRKDLGFKGIIISDELLNMQAIEGYAFQQDIKEPHINEIVIMAFQAGTDIVIIYPEPDKAGAIIGGIVRAVDKAVEDGKISEREIDNSVKRILKAKERIFNKRLLPLIKDMSLEEKIAQRIMIDIYEDKDTAILNKYGLGGIEARDYKLIEKAQENAKIPLFIACQHEGGKINETNLNIYSRSAYLTGKEFEGTFGKEQRKQPVYVRESNKNSLNKPDESFFDFSQLAKEEQQKIIDILCGSVDEHIKFFSDIKENKYMLPNPDYLSPLTTGSDASSAVGIKSFEAVPIAWLIKFPDKNTALCAYKVFKEAFNRWSEKENIREKLSGKNSFLYPDEMLYELNLLQGEIQKIQGKENKKNMRILCLAAHPDDEDAEALIYFKKRFNAETYVLLATRGEGGENRIGPELYQELGALRTEEMERAASMIEVKKVFYLGKKDFGYCSEPQEAFQKWDKQDTLSRLVYFYRLIQPDIIITKHNVSSGHCQHRALAVLAQEAFDLAGNPKAYPEMIKDGLLPRQPLRFFQRTTGKKDFILDEIVIDTQERGFREGKTYQQIAQEALSQHRSQGFSADSFANVLPSGKIAYESQKTLLKPQNLLENNKSLQKIEGVVASGFPGIKIVNGLKIGLFEENSNIFFVALKTLGYDFKKIDSKFIAEGDLSEFDIIVLSKNINNLLSEGKDIDRRILKFAEEGGRLIIFLQDNTQQEFNLSPYPLKISFEPMSKEDAPVTILLSKHPLFSFPNKIIAADFEGWVQDRGLLSASEYSAQYAELISCLSSTGKAIKGGYLVAHYGKGSYIFTTYSWYRQLREFHFGAYKNLANMLAYSSAKSPIREP